MDVKFVQINIYKGKYLEALISFLKKQDADFISMQEVTTNGFNLCSNKHISVFDVIRDRLGMNGVFHGDLKLKGDKTSVFGNAVLTKHKIVSSHVEVLKKYKPVTNEELDGESGEVREQIDKHLLDAAVEFNGQKIHVMSWHGAWTAPPRDTAETLRQSGIVANYLKAIVEPFILGGDLNNIMGTKTIGQIEDAAVNLMRESSVRQTTHPKVHKIVPRGFLVDYIFVSRGIKLRSIEVPDVLVSDHLPVAAILEV